jgi:hypothetical protein
MNFLQAIVLLFGCGFMFCGCSKPPHIHAGGDTDELGPVVKEVKLADTISPSFTHALHLESVIGSAFRYPLGRQASYFAYVADPDEVLKAITRLPFPMRDHAADVSYHKIDNDEWNALRHTVGIYEVSGAAFFWDVDPRQFFIYESVKNEHHLLLVDRNSRRILHRIASSG